jgi:D,D-heptose 1,7-bisphosphate phosphatase
MKKVKSKALFLDRDGVIIRMHYNLNTGLIHVPFLTSQVIFNDDVFPVLRAAKALGFKLILISNQPNISFKKISRKNFEKIRHKINNRLKTENIKLDGEYYCYHHPRALIATYRKECNCRKPAPGLLIRAAKEHQLDLKKSWFIGDSVTDVMAGHKVGCRTILVANVVESEYLRVLEQRLKTIKPDKMVKNFSEIIPILNAL